MARSQPDAPRGPDPRYLAKDARRESLTEPAEDHTFPFDTRIAKIATTEELEDWIAERGCLDLFEFIQYATRDHDERVTVHNEMVQMMDDANTVIRELEDAARTNEETIKQRDAVIGRLITINHKGRGS